MSSDSVIPKAGEWYCYRTTPDGWIFLTTTDLAFNIKVRKEGLWCKSWYIEDSGEVDDGGDLWLGIHGFTDGAYVKATDKQILAVLGTL